MHTMKGSIMITSNQNDLLKRVVIWGTSGHSKVVAEIISHDSRYKLVGYLDDFVEEAAINEFDSLPILGGREQLDRFKEFGIDYLVWGFGNCQAKLRLRTFLELNGIRLLTVEHARSIVSCSSKIGEGSLLAAGAIIGPDTTIGHSTIVNTGASVDHDCSLGNAVHIAPGARLAGSVSVGDGSWVGLGALVKEGVSIGAGAMIGAGALVLSDIPDGVIAYGMPAKVVRRVESEF